MTAVLDHIHAEVLISLIKERRVLWDKSYELYGDIQKKQAAWHEICRSLRPEYDSWTKNDRENFGKFVTSKWANLRSCFKRAEKHEKERKKLGRSTKPYVYKNQLMFLKESRPLMRNSSDSDDDMDEPEIVVKKEADDSLNREDTSMASAAGPNTPIEVIIKQETDDSLNREDSSSMVSAAGPNTPMSEEIPLEYHRSWNNISMPEGRMSNMVPDGRMSNHSAKEESHHLLFFRSILPSIEQFDEDDTLQLQANILASIQKIRKKRQENSK